MKFNTIKMSAHNPLFVRIVCDWRHFNPNMTIFVERKVTNKQQVTNFYTDLSKNLVYSMKGLVTLCRA